MGPLLTVAGRDVLFAHWPVDPSVLAERLPNPLVPATFERTGWVSVLALENRSVGLGDSAPRRSGAFGGVPQLNFRTYVTPSGEGDVGVYFLSLDTGRRSAAVAARRGFGLPFHHASMRLSRRDDRVTFQSQRRNASDTPAVFQARYRPTGAAFRAEPGTLEAFCVEQFRYYFPAAEDHRAVSAVDGADDGVRVGRVTHDPWTLRPVEATIRTNTLFEAAELPTPDAEPTTHYSPGFEMGVERVETRRVE